MRSDGNTICKIQRMLGQRKVKENPWLLHAIHGAVGRRFWLGGICKIGNDVAQFVGSVCLSSRLESMQNGDSTFIGYVYAAMIFVGVIGGVISEGQYFQNVMHVGFQIRSTLVGNFVIVFVF